MDLIHVGSSLTPYRATLGQTLGLLLSPPLSLTCQPLSPSPMPSPPRPQYPSGCCLSISLELLVSLLNSTSRPRAYPVRLCCPWGLVVVLGSPTLDRSLMGRPSLCSKPCIGKGALEVAFGG